MEIEGGTDWENEGIEKMRKGGKRFNEQNGKREEKRKNESGRSEITWKIWEEGEEKREGGTRGDY